MKEATNILQVVALHHLFRVISNVPLHTSASNIWLMLWLWTKKLRGKRNTSLAQVRKHFRLCWNHFLFTGLFTY